MKKLFFIISLFIGITLYGQHSISGSLSPANEYKWLIAYRLKPGTQVYVAQSEVKEGAFKLDLPANSEPGTYRIVYAVPQDEFYFDVIYNGKEDIEVAFSQHTGVSFLTSKENILFNMYFKEINDLEQQIVDYYTQGSQNRNNLKNASLKINEVQKSYEEKTMGLMANKFITSNHVFIPQIDDSVYDYVKGKKDNYFNGMDVTNPMLQASGFLTNKLANYVFTALPLKTMTPQETEDVIMENVRSVDSKLQTVDDKYKLHLFYSLWSQAAASGKNNVSDFIYTEYLKELASSQNNEEIISNIDVHNRLRPGAIAPNLEWHKENEKKTLSELNGADNYVLVFWSSTCGHCLRELPSLHEEFASNEKVKVIAVGLEEDELNWKREIKKLNQFEHVIALGKWDSEYAALYAVNQTPTYFILDSEKRIIAKPEDNKDVIEFIANN
ncbi:TlpA family protein disulfide reductase [Maribacter sp. HTCC2170]|uniref:TlpA family protein disulfide reductase n=1 Tax=Maribacter sp. (strain HTCC2170 / KCCM 42371) TaxID=313603 RepID=UPI00006BD388|nr:TlpA disulfide reductase family protein [Maribacter sp. HTCC2170]EAR02478.1 thiol:disulfide interchange protein [Maribacter sp. HTCC2170]